MKRNLNLIMLTLLLQNAFAQRDFYTPKSLIMPLHDRKNQLHISVGRGGGYDVNVSYALTDKFALFHTATLDNGSKSRTTIFKDRYHVDRNDHVWRGGVGYFFKAENRAFPIVEVYGGGGFSKIDNYWYFAGETDGEFTEAKYWTAFGQFNAGKKTIRSEYALGLRIAYSQYTDFNFYSNHPYSGSMNSSYENLKGLTADPVVSSSYNLKGLKLNAEAGWAIPIGFASVRKVDTYDSRTTVSSEESVPLWSLLDSLSLQYNFNLGKD